MHCALRLGRPFVHPALFTLALSVPIAGLLVAARPYAGAKAPAPRGRVWVVGGQGGIPTIQGAVNSAADGDAILVKSGNYPAFSIVNKDLRVVADEGANVSVLGHVSVDHLASGKTVLLSGLVFK